MTGDAHFPRKPNPASLNYLCTKFGIIRTEAVMVGDRPLDVEAGRRAGCRDTCLIQTKQLLQRLSATEESVN